MSDTDHCQSSINYERGGVSRAHWTTISDVKKLMTGKNGYEQT